MGGLRTALYNYLIARQTKGAFILRIEDTDQEREVKGATENILSSLAWAGIVPDEGVMLRDDVVSEHGSHGPYIQSKRTDLYREYADKLIASGHAYHCFCTKDRLEEMRKSQEAKKQAPMYDRHCLGLDESEVENKVSAGEPHVIRMKVPREKTVRFHDDIRGDVAFQGHTIDDQVLLKSDGFPTYHLANVVDDHLMNVDLVLRGEEWLSSTPKHILLYEAFQWTPPKFAHVPLLLNADKTKLSKRQGSVAVQEYIDKGYLPEAMLNFLALLGWNPGTTKEMFTMEELIEEFSLERVQKAGAIFDLQKLDWLQGQWMRTIPPADFASRILPIVAEKYPQAKKDELFSQKASLIQQRITFFTEAADMMSYFYAEPAPSVDLLANSKQGVEKKDLPMIMKLLTDTLSAVSDKQWTLDHLKDLLFAAAEKNGMKKGQILWPLRAALTGREYSPGAFEVAEILGKEKTMTRLQRAGSIPR